MKKYQIPMTKAAELNHVGYYESSAMVSFSVVGLILKYIVLHNELVFYFSSCIQKHHINEVSQQFWEKGILLPALPMHLHFTDDGTVEKIYKNNRKSRVQGRTQCSFH